MSASRLAVIVLLAVLPAGCFLAEVPSFEEPPGNGPPGQAPELVNLSVGDQNACAARADGKVLCWGANAEGVLGTPHAKLPFVLRPVLVPGIDAVVEVDVGAATACARQASGVVVCWGRGEVLGDGVGTSRPTPALVVDLPPASSVLMEGNHACAVLVDGGLACWGNAKLLGPGPTTGLTAERITGLSGVTAAARADDHACAVAGGAVWCWGYPMGGALGDGGTTAPALPVNPVQALGLTDAVQVATGYMFTCARRADGTVSCWGTGPVAGANPAGKCDANTSGQFPCNPAPVAVPGLAMITRLVAGDQHACALDSWGLVHCWGAGPLGDGVMMGLRSAPALVPNLTDVVELSAAHQTTCARRANREVVCWGANTNGMFGNGTTDASASPTPVVW